jgi:hypothetical protein
MKFQIVARWMVLAAIVLVAAQAFAAPVNLVCAGVFNNIDELHITFDEESRTAFLGKDTASPASFTDNNIKWSGSFDYMVSHPLQVDYNLNRISGILTVTFSDRRTWDFNCVVAKKKF